MRKPNPRYVFSREQIEEQKQFVKDLKAGRANIVFEGTFKEGISFLKDTGDLVDVLCGRKS